MFDSYHFQHYHFFFTTLSSLLANFLFQLLIFVKCHVGLSITMRQGVNTRTRSAVCVGNKRCTVTNHKQIWKKWRDWSLVMMCICYIHGDLWAEELAAYIYTYGLYTGNKFEPCYWGTGYLTNLSGKWNSCTLESSKSSTICV